MTVGALMSRTGSSRPAFYQYFADLHGLMETLLRDLEGEILVAAEPWIASEGGDPVHDLRQVLSELVRFAIEEAPFCEPWPTPPPLTDDSSGRGSTSWVDSTMW